MQAALSPYRLANHLINSSLALPSMGEEEMRTFKRSAYGP